MKRNNSAAMKRSGGKAKAPSIAKGGVSLAKGGVKIAYNVLDIVAGRSISSKIKSTAKQLDGMVKTTKQMSNTASGLYASVADPSVKKALTRYNSEVNGIARVSSNFLGMLY
jgi:hypothetical protein